MKYEYMRLCQNYFPNKETDKSVNYWACVNLLVFTHSLKRNHRTASSSLLKTQHFLPNLRLDLFYVIKGRHKAENDKNSPLRLWVGLKLPPNIFICNFDPLNLPKINTFDFRQILNKL